MQTAHGSIETVVQAMRAGAIDFVVKPVGAERLQVSIKNAMRVDSLEDEIRRMRRRASGTLSFKDLATASPDMTRVIRLAERAAKSNIPVLIEGESGVGKEVLARAIQGSSDRKGKAFVTVNCGAIPDNLVESILFGHEKGAFTGATERHVGKFVEASGGTLFLDEIGELPLDAQVKLLRAIQEGEVDPVGAKKPVKVDIRLISATNKSLLDLVKGGGFREDLYYRLNVFPMTLPPLRARREDIPDLARSFLARFAAEEGKRVRGIAAEALSLLVRYDWPGNVRQLENALFRAVVLADGDELTLAEFPQIVCQVEGFELRIPPGPDLRRRRAGAGARDRPGRGARSARHQPRRRDRATCASSRSSRPRSSASRCSTTAATCRRCRAGSASGARPFTVSSKISGSLPRARRTRRDLSPRMNDDADRNGRACSGVGVAALPLRIAARDAKKRMPDSLNPASFAPVRS